MNRTMPICIHLLLIHEETFESNQNPKFCTARRFTASPSYHPIAVVTGDAWPANFCTVTISTPASNKSLQNVRSFFKGECNKISKLHQR